MALATAAWRRFCNRKFHWRGLYNVSESHSTSELSFYDSTIEEYAAEPLERMSLLEMLRIGSRAVDDPRAVFQHAEYVRTELPKRLARRVLDLQFLPYIFVTNPHIKRVYNAYKSAFQRLIECERITTMSQNEDFAGLLRRLVDEHTPMLDSLASGVRDCRNKRHTGEHLQLDRFLEGMLRSRISRRVIAEHHLNLHKKRSGYIGCVKTHISVHSAVDHAANRARMVCIETFGDAPGLQLLGDLHVAMPYIPVHLDYVLFELMKNSMRAVVEVHQRSASSKTVLPPIQVRICEAPKEVTIKISDRGGGIDYDKLENIWEYGYTTLAGGMVLSDSGSFDLMDAMGGAGKYRIAGLGFGLPFSRLHARYFGGDLQLVSLAGYGCDAFLRLRKLQDHDWMETVEEGSDCEQVA
ncbi:hypothetical protein BSKO_01202 [Bryopsis sp. KO-2023]|nr:hypothetical protein BSKO_01202 [Bryopsis sp. KO-2023]